MYNLPYFKENNEAEVLRFMQEFPFIMLTGVNADHQPVATQVPVFMDIREGKMYLSGHMMKSTDHQLAFAGNKNVLAIFTGPHCYVSATWYDNPHQASTWNYMSVHARGHIRFGEGEELVQALRRLTLHYEKNNSSSSTIYDNLPEAYTAKLMKAIVAFEIEITEIDNVFKLSQNRDAKSFANIIGELEKQEGDARRIAAEMKKRQSTLYPQ